MYFYQKALALLLCCAFCFPAAAVEAGRTAQKVAGAKPQDIKLAAKNSLVGKLVTPQGKALVDAEVLVLNKRDRIAVKTNKDGVFVASNLKMGVYTVQVGQQHRTVRVWEARVAPPKAVPAGLFVAGDSMNGQGRGLGLLGLGGGQLAGASMPVMIAIGTSVAVAVTAAVANNDDDDDAS